MSFTCAASFLAAERCANMIDSRSSSGDGDEPNGEVPDSGAKRRPKELQSLVREVFETSDRIGRRAVDAALGLVPDGDCRCGAAGASQTLASERSTPAGFGAFHRTRNETLEIVARLSQAEIDRAPAPDKWSVSEVLDHLTRVDRLFRGAFDELVARKRDARPAFVFRGLADSRFSIPGVPNALLPLFDPPVALLGIAVPRSLRQVVARNRRVPTQAPRMIRPKKGRAADDLRDELRQMLEYVGSLFSENPDIRFSELFYYNPLTGFTTVPGILSFTASHESRHQQQLREIIASACLPEEA